MCSLATRKKLLYKNHLVGGWMLLAPYANNVNIA